MNRVRALCVLTNAEIHENSEADTVEENGFFKKTHESYKDTAEEK